jgi:hypothetical protein
MRPSCRAMRCSIATGLRGYLRDAMSYVRFGEDGSDVYVFTSATGLECCACALQLREWVENAAHPLGRYLKEVGPHVEQAFRSNHEMIAHLELHIAAGDSVPDYVFTRLRDPADAAENERIWAEDRI